MSRWDREANSTGSRLGRLVKKRMVYFGLVSTNGWLALGDDPFSLLSEQWLSRQL